MPEEACITVPVDAKQWLTGALTDAGLTVLDTGERVTTEAGVAAEAVLCVARLQGSPAAEEPISEGTMAE
jgi:hypothetical protein